jgi:uncharacterized membrane protein HdeD (DUF308 family)
MWPAIGSALIAVGIAYALHMFVGRLESAFIRLALDSAVMAASYSVMLLFVMGQKEFYFDLLSHLPLPRMN